MSYSLLRVASSSFSSLFLLFIFIYLFYSAVTRQIRSAVCHSAVRGGIRSLRRWWWWCNIVLSLSHATLSWLRRCVVVDFFRKRAKHAGTAGEAAALLFGGETSGKHMLPKDISTAGKIKVLIFLPIYMAFPYFFMLCGENVGGRRGDTTQPKIQRASAASGCHEGAALHTGSLWMLGMNHIAASNKSFEEIWINKKSLANFWKIK